MLDSDALRQVGKLIADCDRRWFPYAVTEKYLDALARAAATVRQARGRAEEDRVMVDGEPGGVLLVRDPMQGLKGASERASSSRAKSGRACAEPASRPKPRAAGSERSGEPGRRRAHAHAIWPDDAGGGWL